MSGRLLHNPGPEHRCDPPGRRERRRLGVLHNAIWACDCGQHWKWDSSFDGRYWEIYYPTSEQRAGHWDPAAQVEQR